MDFLVIYTKAPIFISLPSSGVDIELRRKKYNNSNFTFIVNDSYVRN